jgi:hypothetical protein
MMTFMLVSDSLKASHHRHQLALSNTTGVKVGNFSALLDLLSELWLLSPPEDTWKEKFKSCALGVSDAFWSKSLAVDETATLSQVRASLALVLEGVPLTWESTPEQPVSFQKSDHPRLGRYFNDLSRLWVQMEGVRPYDQMRAALWLAQSHQLPIEPVQCHCMIDIHDLPLWQKTIVERLQELTPVVKPLLELDFPKLKTWHQALLAGDPKPSDADHPVVCFSCRDILAECRAVASMIQSEVELGIAADQFAVMLPTEQTDYVHWLGHYLNQAGILVSNDSRSQQMTDWQAQLIKDLLIYQAQQQPTMQLQSIITNPLMPWTRSKGQFYATRIANNDLKPLDEVAEDKAFIQLIQQPLRRHTPSVLSEWIDRILDHCKELVATPLTAARLSNQRQLLQKLLDEVDVTDWSATLSRVLNQWHVTPIRLSDEARYRLNAVTFIDSDQQLPYSVHRLYVMGFNDSHYEQPNPNAGAIAFEDWQGLTLEYQQSSLAYVYSHAQFGGTAWFTQWVQSLAQSQQQIIITTARQAYDGSVLHPSRSWLSLAQTIATKLEVDALITPIESATHPLLHWHEVPLSPITSPSLPECYEFNQSLLDKLTALNNDTQRPESPSSLETLIVSPLAWLFNRMGIETREWKVQQLDNALQGSIAHKVFELYGKHQNAPMSNDLFDELYESAVNKLAPFMQQAHWRIEKANLKREIHRAFEVFVPWSKQHGWKVEHVEQKMEGRLWDWPIKGFIDAILHSTDQVFILDYKKSKSDDRYKRLNAGFDLQTYIYRQLYTQSNGSANIVTGYFNLNDRVMVLDQAIEGSNDIEVQTPDLPLEQQSAQAVDWVTERFAQLRLGQIMLNHASEAKAWKSRGIKAYAFENSLVKLAMHPDAEDFDDEGDDA